MSRQWTAFHIWRSYRHIFLITAVMLVRTLILLRNCDFKQCNGNIDYYTVTLPMSKKTFYPVRKVRIIKEYYTPRFKRDNSPDSCIPALPNLTQSVTTDTFSQRSFFWLRYKCKCINPVTMCRGTVLQVLIYQQNLAPNSFTWSNSCPP